MKKVGITGNFAAGKSYILDIISRFGYKIFSCDFFVNQLYQKIDIQEQIVSLTNRFSGSFQKDQLAEIIYNHQEDRKKIENLVHPLVLQAMHDFTNTNSEEEIVFLEVPLLFEAGFESFFDKIICVYADRDTRLSRAISKRNVTKDLFEKIEKLQMPQEEKITRSDYIINSSDYIIGKNSSTTGGYIKSIIENIKGEKDVN